MYFSRIELDRHHAKTMTVIRGIAGDGYGAHQHLWGLFGHLGADGRPFLFRRLDVGQWPTFYVVSRQMPTDREGVWCIAVKEYNPQLRVGDRLAFELRANPVVTRTNSDDEHPKRARHDVVMDARSRMDPEARKSVSTAELSETAGRQWLEARSERLGFQVAAVRVDGYCQHRVAKKRRTDPIRFSTLDFTGLLEVCDPDVFVRTLYTGVGPAKAFGCGLLLVRKVASTDSHQTGLGHISGVAR